MLWYKSFIIDSPKLKRRSNDTHVYEIVSSAPEKKSSSKIQQFCRILCKYQPNAIFSRSVQLC